MFRIYLLLTEKAGVPVLCAFFPSLPKCWVLYSWGLGCAGRKPLDYAICFLINLGGRTSSSHIYIYYKTNKPREVFPVASLTINCGFEQCTPDFGPRARGKEGLGSGAIFGFSF